MDVQWMNHLNKGDVRNQWGEIRSPAGGRPSIQRFGEVRSYQDASVLFGQHG